MSPIHKLSCLVAVIALATIIVVSHSPACDAILPANQFSAIESSVASSTSEEQMNPVDQWTVTRLSDDKLASLRVLDSKLETAINQLEMEPPNVNAARETIASMRKTTWAFRLPNGLKVDTRLDHAAKFLETTNHGYKYALSQLKGLQDGFVKPTIAMSTAS
ncbi:hypothetical protein BDF22DRAFT_745004 [Syncephalis plumigaleata]|nr:hypothetical protein BDF22DRAFT_745004 [Syncephalis plumigaleata]